MFGFDFFVYLLLYLWRLRAVIDFCGEMVSMAKMKDWHNGMKTDFIFCFKKPFASRNTYLAG